MSPGVGLLHELSCAIASVGFLSTSDALGEPNERLALSDCFELRIHAKAWSTSPRANQAAAAILLGAGWGFAGQTHANNAHGWGSQSGLVQTAKAATARFRDVEVAASEGYGLFLGCVSGPDKGAMGVHYANGGLVADDVVDADQPEVLVYERLPRGGLRLAAVEYLVLAEAWHASHEAPPVLEGQSFHYTGSPNRYGLPPFYALHVWAWRNNPSGAFANWNPLVSCESYTPITP